MQNERSTQGKITSLSGKWGFKNTFRAKSIPLCERKNGGQISASSRRQVC